MDTDAIAFQQPTGPRPPSKHEGVWNELEHLHAQLGIAPPTATYSLEDLEADVVLARRAVHRTRRDKDHLHLASVSATMCQGCAWRGLAGGTRFVTRRDPSQN